jgi:hypothetical protein
MTVALSFPTSDTALLQWSQNIVNLITPAPATYNLVAADVTTYTALHTAYSTALAGCDPAQRNRSAVVAKNAARAALKAGATLLANKVYASATVTDAQKTALGIPPRKTPAPIPAPSTSPTLEVLSVNGWTVKIKLRQSGSGKKRGKPAGVSGASVFSFVGVDAPGDISAWKFEGNTGRTNIDVAFANTIAAGAKVWLTAFWFNGRKQSGPACAPVSTNLQGGSVSMAA